MKKHYHIKQNNKTMKPNTVAKRKAKSQNMNRKIKKQGSKISKTRSKNTNTAPLYVTQCYLDEHNFTYVIFTLGYVVTRISSITRIL